MAASAQEGQGDVVHRVGALRAVGLEDQGVVDGQQDLVDLGAIAAPVQARVSRVHRELEDEVQLRSAVRLGPARVDGRHGDVAQVARHVGSGISVTPNDVLKGVAVHAVRRILHGAVSRSTDVEVEAAELPQGGEAIAGALALGAAVVRADEEAGLHARLEHRRDAELVPAGVDVAGSAEVKALIEGAIAVVVEAVTDLVARRAHVAGVQQAAGDAE